MSEFLAKARGVTVSTYNALECIRMRMEWANEYRRQLDAMTQEEEDALFDVRILLDDVASWTNLMTRGVAS